MLIQTSWNHVEQLGFGMKFMHKHGVVWMLSRILLKYYLSPDW